MLLPKSTAVGQADPAMESSIFVSDPIDLKYFYTTEFGRIYFGNEFCTHLFPSVKQLENVRSFARRNDVSFTLVTPPFFDGSLPRLVELLERIAPGTEVVFNDWGLFRHIVERKLVPVHGRLLCSVKKDPRIDPAMDFQEYFRSSNLIGPYQDYLLAKGITRVELDNVRQGYTLDLKSAVSASLYYPFVQCTVTRKCIFYNLLEDNNKFKISDSCPVRCFNKSLKLFVDGSAVNVVGNAQYYVNDSRPEDPARWNVDRTVYMPRFPNQNSFNEDDSYFDWSSLYEEKVGEGFWGSDPDQTLASIIRSLSLPANVAVFDVGCGAGKHAALFRQGEVRYVGLDIAGPAIEAARAAYPGRKFICQDIFEFSQGEELFDLIIDSGCLHTVPPWKRKAYLQKLGGLLKRGGRYVLSAWESDHPQRPLLYVRDRIPEWGLTTGLLTSLCEGLFKRETTIRKRGSGRELLYVVFTREE